MTTDEAQELILDLFDRWKPERNAIYKKHGPGIRLYVLTPDVELLDTLEVQGISSVTKRTYIMSGRKYVYKTGAFMLDFCRSEFRNYGRYSETKRTRRPRQIR